MVLCWGVYFDWLLLPSVEGMGWRKTPWDLSFSEGWVLVAIGQLPFACFPISGQFPNHEAFAKAQLSHCISLSGPDTQRMDCSHKCSAVQLYATTLHPKSAPWRLHTELVAEIAIWQPDCNLCPWLLGINTSVVDCVPRMIATTCAFAHFPSDIFKWLWHSRDTDYLWLVAFWSAFYFGVHSVHRRGH